MQLNYHHLRYFWAVAHDGNLGRTARNLFVSQSALSMQIKALEQQLGHKLFERRGRQLIITEAGKVVLDHADAIFTTGNELLAKLRSSGLTQQKVIRIGVLATLSRNFQMQFVSPLLKRRDVDLIISSGSQVELLSRLQAHQIDLILTNMRPIFDSTTPWITHTIADQTVSLVGLNMQGEKGKSLKELVTTFPLVVPSVSSTIRQGFDGLLDGLGVSPRIVAEVDDMAILRLIARQHIGLTLVSPIVVSEELASGQLQEVKNLPDLKESFYAVTIKRKFPNPLLKTILPLNENL